MNNSADTRIEQYASSHAIPPGKLQELGWRFEYHKDSDGKERPAIRFQTQNGPRWRFVDGNKPKYHHDKTYKACWYGLEKSVKLLAKHYVVDCNGAASTIAGYFAGIPAYSYQSGEGTTPDDTALETFISLVDKKIVVLVAFDCDPEGQRGAAKRVNWYRKHGYMSEAVDLALDKSGGDVADFVAAHPVNAAQSLLDCEYIYVETEKEAPKPRKPIDFPHDKENDYELAALALDALRSSRRDNYDEWYEVGMALQELGERGLYLWDNWSSNGEGYKAGACAKKWKSFKKGGINLGSLFHWATEDLPTWRPYKPAKGRTARTIDAQPATSYEKIDVHWVDGVPTSVRAAAVSLLPASVAPVFELWFEGSMRGDLEWDTPITSQYLLCLSDTYQRGLTKKQIDRGLSSGLGQLWSKPDLDAEQFGTTFPMTQESDNDSLLEDKNKIGKVVPKSTQSQIYTPCRKLIGRKAVHYQLLPRQTILANLAKLAIVPILEKWFPVESGIVPPIRAEFLKQLGCDDNEAARLEKELDAKYGDQIASQPNFALTLQRAKKEFKRYERTLANPHSAPIPDGLTYANKSEYLRTCARAILTQENGATQWSMSAWSTVLGCAPRSLDGIFTGADIRQEKNQHCDVPIATIEQLQHIDRAYSKECQGYPSEVVSSRKRDAFPFEPGQPLYIWAGAELEAGATVVLRYQQAHKQFLDPLSKPQPLTHWRYLCQRVVIAIMIANPIPFKESKPKKKKSQTKPKPTYAEKVITTMVGKFTPLSVDDGAMIDPLTGEYVEPSIQAMIAALLNASEPQPDPFTDDPLVAALLKSGGEVVSVEYHEAELAAA